MTKYFVKNTDTGEVIGNAYFETKKEAELLRRSIIGFSVVIEFLKPFKVNNFGPITTDIKVNMNYRESNTVVCCKEEPKLQLEVGKFYKSREGFKVRVIYDALKDFPEMKDSSIFRFICIALDYEGAGSDDPYQVDKNGMYAREEGENALDLISEWED